MIRTLIASFVLGTLGFAGAAVMAQDDEASRAATFSQPLAQHTLDTLFPVRSEAEVREQIETGRQWQQHADAMMSLARQREGAASGQLAVKKAEVKTLEVRRKAAKKNKAADELSQVDEMLVTETRQVKALEAVLDMAKAEQRAAEAWGDAGRALTQAAEAEAVVLGRRAKLADTEGVGSRWNTVDPDTWEQARKYNEAVDVLATRLEEAGRRLEQLSDDRRAVLEEWKPGKGR